MEWQDKWEVLRFQIPCQRFDHRSCCLSVACQEEARVRRFVLMNTGVANEDAGAEIDACLNGWVRTEPIQQVLPRRECHVHSLFLALPEFIERGNILICWSTYFE